MGVVLFVREDLLKASHYKLITVAGHTRRGKWIDPYQANVLVSDDHDTDKVAAGQGSHYQKQAHKKLAEKVEGFHTMNPDAKATIILAQATKMQKEASQSAALSNWKKEALAGNNPKPSMWAAFYALDNAGRAALLAQVGSKVGDTDHLHAPSNPNLKPAQAPVNIAPVATENVASSHKFAAGGDDLPPKIKAKLDDWATDGYVDRLQDAVNDNGSSAAYSAYAKKLLEQFESPAGPTVDTPVPADAKKTMDGMFADGNKALLQAVAANNSANPHVAAYAQKLLDQLESSAPAYSVKLAPVGGLGSEGTPLHTVVDFAAAEKLLGLAPGALEEDDSTTYTITNASGQTFSVYKHKGVLSVRTAGNNKSQESALELKGYLEKNAPYVPAPIKIKTGPGGIPLKPDVGSFESTLTDLESWLADGKHGKLQDAISGLLGLESNGAKAALAYAEAGVRYLQKQALGPKEGDTKVEDGKTYVLQGGKWHLVEGANHEKYKAAVAAFETGSYYQKEALKKLKTEHGAAWDSMHPFNQHDLAQAKYQALQGAASQAAAVSGWKKNILAGKVPTPGEVKAFAAMAAQDSDKAGKLLVEVQKVIGGDKLALLVSQAHAKAAQAAKTAPVPGNMTFEPVAKPAVVVTKDKPAAPVKVMAPADTYHNTTNGHNKFWQVSTHGNVMKTVYGKIGTNGSVTEKTFGSSKEADDAAWKLSKEKKAKGYVYHDATTMHEYVGAAPAAPSTGGWVFTAKNEGMSGAQTLDVEAPNGDLITVAKTEDGSYQVINGGPDGSVGDDYSDYGTLADAMDQVVGLHGVSTPPLAMLQKLDPDYQANDPKDGDTKPGANGTTLVFKNGRWHAQAAQSAIAVPDFSDDTSMWGNIYAKAAKELQSAFESGGAAAVKKLVTVHKTGAKAGKFGATLGGGKFTVGPADTAPRRMKMYAFIKAILESNAKGGAKVAFTTSPPTAAAPKPAAPKAAPPESIKPAVIFTTEPGKPKVTPMDGWTQIGPQKGSNPGGKFKDKNGKEWYCKFPATEDHAKNELLASKLYLAAGVDAPSLRLVSQNGKVGIASKFVDGVTKVGAGIKSAPGAMEGFAVDAWLGNYDSVGTGFDNLLKNKDGKAVRIDVGGSILYRAQGAPKGDAYGDVVNEIDAMRDPAKNQYGAAVFSGITKDQLDNSVALVLDITDDVIQQLVEKFGPGTKQEKIALTAKLIARKKDLAKRFPAADLIANPPKPDPRHLPVEPSKLPKKLDFLNWKGPGQGLSGTAKVNEVNQKAVDEIYASAMAGDYVAFKKLQFHVVDKSTGAVSTGSSFGSHPSQHIKDFYSLVMDYMEVIANPAAKKQKVWETEDYSDITELSDAFKAHYYGVTVGQVPANQRLGYWISLGQADAAASFMPAKVEYISAADKAKGSASTKGMTAILKKWMAAVKKTGSANQPYRDGKEIDNSGLKTRDVLTDAYAHAVELTEGTRITKGMTMPDAMLQQMIALPDGHVFQNPGSMCCSKNEDWGWGGNTRLKIIYAKGAKALYNIGVGQYDGEGEITTVPGQRFMLLKKDMKSKPPEFTLLMLPPDETYVANIKPKATP